jgi:hypothetical protein
MNRTSLISATLLSAVLLFAASALSRYGEVFPEMEREAINKTLSFSNPAGAKSLSVDNVEALFVAGHWRSGTARDR